LSLEFLDVQAAEKSERFSPAARSPMERQARAAGARFEERDGWTVAVAYASPEKEAETFARTVGWADCSHLAKLELQADSETLQAVFAENTGAPFELGFGHRASAAWWCPVAPTRLLVVCEPSRLAPVHGALRETPGSLVDVTTAFAALTLGGPAVREAFARFCALDLRPKAAPVGAVRPGSVARQPGIVICEGEDRFLMLFGWAVGEYMWLQIQEAAGQLGGAPVGFDALAPLDAPLQEVGL
jgi:heterotetrameric sarcosine oxidase gamma subunit